MKFASDMYHYQHLLLYFWNMKTKVFFSFSVFFLLLNISTYNNGGKKQHEIKMKTSYLSFCIPNTTINGKN